MSLISSSRPRRALQLNLGQGWPGQLGLGLGAVGLGVVAGLGAMLLPNPFLGFALVAGLVVAGLMIARPRFTLGLIVAICCLLPFGIVPVKAGVLTFSLLEAALLVLFGVWLFGLALARRGAAHLVTGPFDWAIFLLLGLSFFSLLLGIQTATATDLHNYFKFSLAILAFFPIINFVRTQQAVDGLLRSLMLLGGLAGWVGLGLYALNRDLQERLLVALGVVGYPTEGRILRYDLDDPARAQRATGTSVDPNCYGGMLVLTITLIITQMMAAKPLLPRWLLALLLLGPSISLYLTYGRGAQLGAVAVIAFVATVKYRRIWLYALPFIGVAALILPNTFLWERLSSGFALEDPASRLRLDEYGNALAIIGRFPWFGIGFGAAPDPDLQAGVSSIYLTVGERMGLVGLAAYLLLIFLFFAFVVNQWGRLSDERQQANVLSLVGGIIGALAVGLLDHYFFNIEYSHMAALFWLFAALTVVQLRLGSPDSVRAEKGNSRPLSSTSNPVLSRERDAKLLPTSES